MQDADGIEEAYAGEFRVLVYGGGSVEELFEAARSRPPFTRNIASITSKTSFKEFKLPAKLRLDYFLRQLRRSSPPAAIKEAHDIYWNPTGPALAIVCGKKIRTKAFADRDMPTPPVMVLFLGTAIINYES